MSAVGCASGTVGAQDPVSAADPACSGSFEDLMDALRLALTQPESEHGPPRLGLLAYAGTFSHGLLQCARGPSMVGIWELIETAQTLKRVGIQQFKNV